MTTQLPRSAPVRRGAFAAVAGLALLVACESKLPTAADVNAMDVASAERGARHAAMIPAGEASSYKIDGKVATSEQAHALAADQIARVQMLVRKTADQPDASEVQIFTKRYVAATGDSLLPLRGTVGDGTSPVRRVFVRKLGDSTHAAGALHPGTEFSAVDPLVMIDGVRAAARAMRALAPAEIVSLDVLKGAAAAKLYAGPEAANGVIRITTRKGAAKQ